MIEGHTNQAIIQLQRGHQWEEQKIPNLGMHHTVLWLHYHRSWCNHCGPVQHILVSLTHSHASNDLAGQRQNGKEGSEVSRTLCSPNSGELITGSTPNLAGIEATGPGGPCPSTVARCKELRAPAPAVHAALLDKRDAKLKKTIPIMRA